MTTVVISQPMYFPWVGFMAQMALADVMIWLDDAQFSRGSFTNRVQVKTASGVKWMSLPLRDKGHRTAIRDLHLADPGIFARHRSLLRNALADAPHLADAIRTFEEATVDAPLCDTLIESAEAQARALGLPARRTLRSGGMEVPGQGSARVLDLVRAVGGTRYVTGHGARHYLDHAAFEAAGVAVDYMDYAPHPWRQAHGAFTPYVTALDLVANVVPEERRAHLNPVGRPWRAFLAAQESEE